jgi:drug/metabolite transporter (DMT)-like permease
MPPLYRVHIATCLFGTAGLFAVTTGLDPLMITFGRTGFAAVTLMLVIATVHHRQPLSVDVRTVVSGLLLAAHWSLFFLSIQLSNVIIGLVMFSVSAIIITLLEPLFFDESFRPVDAVCAVVVVFGIVVIAGTVSDAFSDVAAGIAIGLASSVLFALLQLLNRSLLQQQSALSLSMTQNGIACLVLLPMVWGALAEVSPPQWLQLLFLGCVCTALAHTLFISALRRVSTALAGLIACGMEPVYGAALATLLLSQYPARHEVLGGLIIVSAVVWAQRLRTDHNQY